MTCWNCGIKLGEEDTKMIRVDGPLGGDKKVCAHADACAMRRGMSRAEVRARRRVQRLVERLRADLQTAEAQRLARLAMEFA